MKVIHRGVELHHRRCSRVERVQWIDDEGEVGKKKSNNVKP
jgi:hypothetical protein